MRQLIKPGEDARSGTRVEKIDIYKQTLFRDSLGLDKVSARLGQVSYILNTAGLALGPTPLGPGVKVAGVVVSFVAIGYSGYQGFVTDKMSNTEAWINIGLSLGDISGYGAEKLGLEATGALIGGLSRGGGAANTAYDSVKTAAENKTPGPNPTNAIEVNNPAKTTTTNIDNNANKGTVQPQTESPKKPESTEYVPFFNYNPLSNPGSGGSWSMFSTPLNNGSSGAGGGAGFISPPAAGYNPGN